jgi:hypothetical protein
MQVAGGSGHRHLGLLKAGELRNSPGMPDFSSSTVIILLISAVGLLVLLLGIVIGISRRLTRIENFLAYQESAGNPPPPEETSPGGAFETFLNEDPARRKLPKSEQFAGYRRWRQENGLNWTNS